ncbi:hypothetical protein [Streptomyces sp. 5-10]|uniref:hypothetical protein n=1 Tax=Streptomyces sp. 5-10 TaxID=878925 RepID=UPI00198E2AB1|nr:hypothetical protein [Streptomyces sp. 5-10]MBD3004598.1 hypothetical protein [Streptomyces sp. 5-10]
MQVNEEIKSTAGEKSPPETFCGNPVVKYTPIPQSPGEAPHLGVIMSRTDEGLYNVHNIKSETLDSGWLGFWGHYDLSLETAEKVFQGKLS